MSRLIPLIAILLIAYLVYRGYRQLAPEQRKQWLKKFALGAFFALILFALFTGKLNWLGALIMGLLPFLKNAWSLFWQGKALKNWWDQQQGQNTLASASLILSLDKGVMDGEVQTGLFAKKRLSELDEKELDRLYQALSTEDEKAAGLLQIYLVHRFGNTWQGSPLRQNGPNIDMTEQEARALLGVDAQADKKSIVNAHRKLIQKFHPDRGGNDYLAARLNLAKDLLLKKIEANKP